MILTLGIPFGTYLLHLSLQGPAGYAQAIAVLERLLTGANL